jgi:hypothetical protein
MENTKELTYEVNRTQTRAELDRMMLFVSLFGEKAKTTDNVKGGAR